MLDRAAESYASMLITLYYNLVDLTWGMLLEAASCLQSAPCSYLQQGCLCSYLLLCMNCWAQVENWVCCLRAGDYRCLLLRVMRSSARCSP
jgi:hypothetical protein